MLAGAVFIDQSAQSPNVGPRSRKLMRVNVVESDCSTCFEMKLDTSAPIGTNRSADGRLAAEKTMGKTAEPGTQKLIVCFLGVFVSYLIYGFLQENMWVNKISTQQISTGVLTWLLRRLTTWARWMEDEIGAIFIKHIWTVHVFVLVEYCTNVVDFGIFLSEHEGNGSWDT